MAQKSWHLNRRTFLAGAGMALGLPFLEGMSAAAGPAKVAPPPRFFCGYFPFGVVTLPDSHENVRFRWWPTGEGKDYRLSDTLAPLESNRDEVTIFHGFQHNRVKVPGHASAGFFLTGADTRRTKNAISLDQVAAAHLGDTTRIASLTLSTDGGVGIQPQSHTLSYNKAGQPIPALANPAEIFQRLFAPVTPALRQQMELERSVLDLVLDDARALERRLGNMDRRTMNEYLDSVRTLEKDVTRAQSWLDATREPLQESDFSLKARAENDPRTYLGVMYDLVFQAFRTDTTRVATYQTGSMNGSISLAVNWPRLLGLKAGNAHSLAHSAAKNAQTKSQYDAALVEQFARFIKRLKETPEGESTLLDQTLLIYGSSNSRTHVNSNYPLLLAGGRGLGFRHGHYLKNTDHRPMADILYTVLQGLGVPAKSFADSTGPISMLRA